jgi:hypothetical protein
MMSHWKMITNHAEVLLHIARYPDATAKEIGTACGITERATRKIIADLDAEAYISRKRKGRRVHYTIHPEVIMRQRIIEDKAVGKFLKLFDWEPVLDKELVPVLAANQVKHPPRDTKTPEQIEASLQNLYSQPF